MYNDEAGRAHSLAQQCQQANEATAAAHAETQKALEQVQEANCEARASQMANMRLVDELQRAHQESKDLLIENVRCNLASDVLHSSNRLFQELKPSWITLSLSNRSV